MQFDENKAYRIFLICNLSSLFLISMVALYVYYTSSFGDIYWIIYFFCSTILEIIITNIFIKWSYKKKQEIKDSKDIAKKLANIE